MWYTSNTRDGMLGAKSLTVISVRLRSSMWDTYRRTLVVSTILLGRVALLRRVAAAVAEDENQSVSVFL